jgi:hypothetical protein
MNLAALATHSTIPAGARPIRPVNAISACSLELAEHKDSQRPVCGGIYTAVAGIQLAWSRSPRCNFASATEEGARPLQNFPPNGPATGHRGVGVRDDVRNVGSEREGRDTRKPGRYPRARSVEGENVLLHPRPTVSARLKPRQIRCGRAGGCGIRA